MLITLSSLNAFGGVLIMMKYRLPKISTATSNVRKDLLPWLCALYVEKSERGKSLGSRLLVHGRQEAKTLGFDRLYLCTDHVGYYEKYGWRFHGIEDSEWGGKMRVYEIECGR